MNQMPLTIECEDHQFAPFCFVCIHLITCKSNKWVPVELDGDDRREVDWDYCCPRCYVKHERNILDPDKMHVVCIHCTRKLQQRDGYVPAIKLDDAECGCDECRDKSDE